MQAHSHSHTIAASTRCFGWLLVIAFYCQTVSSQSVPTLINYQGRLVDSSGNPVATANRNLTVNILDAETDGILVFGPQTFTNTPVVNGYYNIFIGPTDENDRSIQDALGGAERFLEVSVDGTPITPRQRILSAPFAIRAMSSEYAEVAASASLPRGYLDGGLITNSEVNFQSQLKISSIVCRDDSNTVDIETEDLEKNVQVTWAQGSNVGGLDSGAIGTEQVVIFVYAIGDSTEAEPGDILFSKDSENPLLPNGYDSKRLIGGRLWKGTSWSAFRTTCQAI